MTALLTSYISAVILLFATIPFLLLPVVLVLLELLFDEFVGARQVLNQHQGALRIYHNGKIHWQSHEGHILSIKLLTRWLILFKIEHSNGQWLIICRDSCDDANYRLIKMLAHLKVLNLDSVPMKGKFYR